MPRLVGSGWRRAGPERAEAGAGLVSTPSDIHKGVTTRSRVAHFCEHYSFVSSIPPLVTYTKRFGLGVGYARGAQQLHEE
jgi:hypothetical protein